MLTKKIQPEGQVDESQRQDPLKPQECYNHPHHPHPEPEAANAILPLLPPALRTQALRLLVYLSERGRSGEPTRASDLVKSHYHGDK